MHLRRAYGVPCEKQVFYPTRRAFRRNLYHFDYGLIAGLRSFQDWTEIL